MKTLSKALVGTVAAGAMAMTSASPAMARDYRDNDRIDTGDIIAGALIIGGIAAVAAAAGNGRDRYDYRDGYKVEGRIAVNTRSNDWRRGWGNDYRGYNDRYSGYDSGKFKCEVRYGRIVDLDYSGIRGL